MNQSDQIKQWQCREEGKRRTNSLSIKAWPAIWVSRKMVVGTYFVVVTKVRLVFSIPRLDYFTGLHTRWMLKLPQLSELVASGNIPLLTICKIISVIIQHMQYVSIKLQKSKC